MQGKVVGMENDFFYAMTDDVQARIVGLFNYSGWLFVILDQARVLAIHQLDIDRPGVG